MKSTAIDLSVPGIAGAYIAFVAATGAEVPVDPFWIAIAALVAWFALGLYRAWANDGKITPNEIADLLGVGKEELDEALGQLKDAKDAGILNGVPSKVDPSEDKTPVIELPRKEK